MSNRSSRPYRDEGVRDRCVAAVAGFFRAALGDSLWPALAASSIQSREEETATRFDGM